MSYHQHHIHHYVNYINLWSVYGGSVISGFLQKPTARPSTQHGMGPLDKTMTLKIGKTNQIPAFIAMQVMQNAQHLEAAGKDIVHLEVGQPSTAPPVAVSRALTAALYHTAAHGYSVALGQPVLRQRIAAHYQDWYGLNPDWNHIAITPG